jgi:hypothetical protein
MCCLRVAFILLLCASASRLLQLEQCGTEFGWPLLLSASSSQIGHQSWVPPTPHAVVNGGVQLGCLQPRSQLSMEGIDLGISNSASSCQWRGSTWAHVLLPMPPIDGKNGSSLSLMHPFYQEMMVMIEVYAWGWWHITHAPTRLTHVHNKIVSVELVSLLQV